MRGKSNRKLTKSQLRARYSHIRKVAKRLQAKGLISDRAKLNIAKPSLAVRKKAESLQGILTGTQQAVALPDVMRSKYKRAGKRTIGRFVIFDKQPNQRIRKRGGEIELIDPTIELPFQTIIPPVSLANIEEFIQWIDDDPDVLQDMLPPGTHFAFTFFGNNSRMIFREAGPSDEPGTLAEYLLHYPLEGAEAWQNLIIIRLTDPRLWRGGAPRFKRRSGKVRGNEARYRSRRSVEYKRYLETHREQKKKYLKEYRSRIRSIVNAAPKP